MKIGDRITFRIRKCAYPVPSKATRLVTGLTKTGLPTVRFAGYSDFVVYLEEITGVE